MSINNIYKRLIKLYLKEINYGNLSINKGRPDKEEIDHYIDVIFKVIKTGIPWKTLNEKLHYTTYFKKFSKWNNLNLFENIHKIIIKILNNRDLLFVDNKDLYIDSTMIKNINGYEYLGSNHYDRNRNGNKISIIVTKTGIPIGIKLAPSNIHDINLVNDTIDNISIKIVGCRIGADKGYISKELKEKLKNDKNIDLITCNKRNSKNYINTLSENIFLKGRYIVENTNTWIKDYRRVNNRYEQKALNYEQIIFFTINNIILNKFKNLSFIDYEFKIEFYEKNIRNI
jgi:transposase